VALTGAVTQHGGLVDEEPTRTQRPLQAVRAETIFAMPKVLDDHAVDVQRSEALFFEAHSDLVEDGACIQHIAVIVSARDPILKCIILNIIATRQAHCADVPAYKPGARTAARHVISAFLALIL